MTFFWPGMIQCATLAVIMVASIAPAGDQAAAFERAQRLRGGHRIAADMAGERGLAGPVARHGQSRKPLEQHVLDIAEANRAQRARGAPLPRIGRAPEQLTRPVKVLIQCG